MLRIIIAISLLLFAAQSIAEQSTTEQWNNIARDVHVARHQITPSSFFNPELLLIRFALKSYRVAVVRARTFDHQHMDAKKIAKASKALATVNANFFDENGKALGVVISQGVRYQGLHNGGKTLTGIFTVGRNLVQILHREAFNPVTAIEAIQAGPRLITDGKIVSDINETKYSRRAGICLTKENDLILFISSGITGLSIPQLQSLLINQNIGCQSALNLDGGGSAQLYVSTELPGAKLDWKDIFIHGHDPAPVFLGIFPISN